MGNSCKSNLKEDLEILTEKKTCLAKEFQEIKEFRKEISEMINI